VLAVLLAAALTVSGCDLPRARANGRCRGNGLAQDGTYILKCTNGRWKRGATIAATNRMFALLLAAKLQSAPPWMPPITGDLGRVWIYGDSNTAPSHPGVPAVPVPTWAGLAMPTATNRALDGRTYLTGFTPFLGTDVSSDLAVWGASIDTVILAGGRNDLFFKNTSQAPISIEQIEAAIATAHDQAAAAGKTVYVMTFLPIRPALWFNETTGPVMQAQIDQVNAWILSRPGWNVIDVATPVQEPGSHYLAAPDNLGDGLHLSTVGQRVVANSVIAYFANHALLPPPPTPPTTTTTTTTSTTTTEPDTTTTEPDTTTTTEPDTTTTTEPDTTTTTDPDTTTTTEPDTTTTTDPGPPGG
jgi:lysophospholipase L1-like esterase